MIRPQTNDANDKAVLRSTGSSQAMQQLPKMMVAAGSGHQIVKLKRPASNHRPMSSNQKQPEQQPSPMQTVWVSKWIDYSSKYGLGYLLSDNAAGVFFNDSTKIVVAQNDVMFYYYERRAVSSTEKQDVMSRYSFQDYPKDLQKKVTLLEHFKSYLS